MPLTTNQDSRPMLHGVAQETSLKRANWRLCDERLANVHLVEIYCLSIKNIEKHLLFSEMIVIYY